MPPKRARARAAKRPSSSIITTEPTEAPTAANTRVRAAKAASMAATRVIVAPRTVKRSAARTPKGNQKQTQPQAGKTAPKCRPARGPPTPVTQSESPESPESPEPEPESDDSGDASNGEAVERARKWRETVAAPAAPAVLPAPTASTPEKALVPRPRSPEAGPSRIRDELGALPILDATPRSFAAPSYATPSAIADVGCMGGMGSIFPRALPNMLYNSTTSQMLLPLPQSPYAHDPLIDRHPFVTPQAPRSYRMVPPGTAPALRDWRVVDSFLNDRSMRAGRQSHPVNSSLARRPERHKSPPDTSTLPRVLNLKDFVPVGEDNRITAMGLDALYAETRAGYDAARAEIEAELDAEIDTLRASYAERFAELEAKHAAEIEQHNQMVETKAAAVRAAARREADHTHIDTEDRDQVAVLANYLAILDWDVVRSIDDLLRIPLRRQRLLWKYKYLFDDNVPALRALSVNSREREALEAERVAAASAHRSVSEPLEEEPEPEPETEPEPQPAKKKARRRR